MDFQKEIAEALAKACPPGGPTVQALMDLLEVPPEWSGADYAFPCFTLAKVLRKSPVAIAEELAKSMEKPDFLQDVKAEKGYLNFKLDPTAISRSTLLEVEAAGEAYGSSGEGDGKTVCLDYSSINIAKPFAIHHLPSTAIGNSLCRIYRHLGYRSVGMNFLGDWGTQFGKMIVAYRLWGDRSRVDERGVRELVELYVRFHDEAEKDPSLDDQGREWFRKIEEGDQEALELFNWFKQVTLDEVNQIYKRLGVEFSDYHGESFFFRKVPPVMKKLEETGLLVESQGAQVVDLDAYNMPPCIIRRSDGATLYVTRDIAAALWRKEHYQFDKCLYVVAYQQNLHFRQWFKVVELMGYEWAQQLQHVAFGMVSMDDGSMSTRKGRIVWMEDVLNKSCEKVLEIIKEKSPGLPDKEEVAEQIGVGAVLFSALYNSRIKDSVFNWDNVVNFDGETAPYAQYTHARCCSLLRKAEDFKLEGEIDWDELGNDEAQAVMKEMAAFPGSIKEAAERYEPFMVARQVIALCKAFNKFYFDHRILEGKEEQMRAKLRLSRAAATVIRTGLSLLGIAAPERM